MGDAFGPGHWPTASARFAVFASLFLAVGLIAVPYALYEARREGLIEACWHDEGRPYTECIERYE